MIRTQIQLEEEQMVWLKRQARDRGVSMSQLIREGIAHYRTTQERVPADVKTRAMAAVGTFSSGCKDVSERHDDYLSLAYGSGADGDE